MEHREAKRVGEADGPANEGGAPSEGWVVVRHGAAPHSRARIGGAGSVFAPDPASGWAVTARGQGPDHRFAGREYSSTRPVRSASRDASMLHGTWHPGLWSGASGWWVGFS